MAVVTKKNVIIQILQRLYFFNSVLEPPQPPPRNVYETIDEEYFEDVNENNIEEEQ